MEEQAKIIAPAQSPHSLVVLMHGYGSNGDDVIQLGHHWSHDLPNTVFIAPNAPECCPHASNGYQWYDLADTSPAVLKNGLDMISPHLRTFIQDQQKKYDVSPEKTACVGFSQGTAVALNLLRESDLMCCSILGYAGELTIPPTEYHATRIQLIHGEADNVVPVERSKLGDQTLRKLGYDVHLHLIPSLGHRIDKTALNIGSAFLIQNLARKKK